MTESFGSKDGEQPDQETMLVIGASSDIGLEIIKQLDRKNLVILAHYNQSIEKLESFRRTAQASTIIPIQADLSEPDGADRLKSNILEQYKQPVKIVHLAASKLEYTRFKDVSWECFERELGIQLRSLVQLLQAFLPGMVAKKKGKVVVVLSSVTLNVPPAALSHYVTVKYAVWGLVRSLAAEYSSKRININAVSPSLVRTAFLEKLPERMVELLSADLPWQRTATPSDVAGTVRFLLSSEADYITGANIAVSGGDVILDVDVIPRLLTRGVDSAAPSEPHGFNSDARNAASHKSAYF